MKNNKKSKSFNKDIESKVNSLTKREYNNKKNKKWIKEQLQKINEEILYHKIHIVGSDIDIYPLWVEAYYYNANKKYMDKACHEKAYYVYNQFDFRIHNKQGRGGIDLYLGKQNKNYYLSFLIKAAIIKESNTKKIYSQMKIADKIENLLKKNNYKRITLSFTSIKSLYTNCLKNNYFIIKNVKRVGLEDGYKSDLASYISLNKKDIPYSTLVKEKNPAVYIKSYKKDICRII